MDALRNSLKGKGAATATSDEPAGKAPKKAAVKPRRRAS
jgi:hypothetical protein